MLHAIACFLLIRIYNCLHGIDVVSCRRNARNNRIKKPFRPVDRKWKICYPMPLNSIHKKRHN